MYTSSCNCESCSWNCMTFSDYKNKTKAEVNFLFIQLGNISVCCKAECSVVICTGILINKIKLLLQSLFF